MTPGAAATTSSPGYSKRASRADGGLDNRAKEGKSRSKIAFGIGKVLSFFLSFLFESSLLHVGGWSPFSIILRGLMTMHHISSHLHFLLLSLLSSSRRQIRGFLHLFSPFVTSGKKSPRPESSLQRDTRTHTHKERSKERKKEREMKVSSSVS